jgi:hypothetical protein
MQWTGNIAELPPRDACQPSQEFNLQMMQMLHILGLAPAVSRKERVNN